MSTKETASKKRKAESEESEGRFVWLLTFSYTSDNEWGAGSFDNGKAQMVFSTKERAIAAMPKFLDEHCPHGKDWRDGLKGFCTGNPRKDADYEYFGDEIGNDGVLISNENADRSDHISVSLARLQVDPPGAGDELRVVDEVDDVADDYELTELYCE